VKNKKTRSKPLIVIVFLAASVVNCDNQPRSTRNSYDSLIYRVFFESKLTVNKEVKVKMFKTVTVELEKYLLTTPLDTLALCNYCLYSLEYQPPEFVFEKIDSMASANNHHPTYAYVIFLYLPGQLRQYQKSILQKRT
jgi:hypothetical protein